MDDKDASEYFVLLGVGIILLVGISEQGIIVQARKKERPAFSGDKCLLPKYVVHRIWNSFRPLPTRGTPVIWPSAAVNGRMTRFPSGKNTIGSMCFLPTQSATMMSL